MEANAGDIDETSIVLWDNSNAYAAPQSYSTSTDGAIKCKNSDSNRYSKSTRIYVNNTFEIAIANSTKASSITGVLIEVNNTTYASDTKTAKWATTGGEIKTTLSQTNVTAKVSGSVPYITINVLKQVRWNKVTVYYTSAGATDPIDPIDPVDPIDPIDPVDPIEPTDSIIDGHSYLITASTETFRYILKAGSKFSEKQSQNYTSLFTKLTDYTINDVSYFQK